MTPTKPVIAVIFGGQTAEHDVSILSGLQALEAIDSSRFDAFPVYMAPDRKWYIGDALRHRKNYIPNAETRKSLHHVTLVLDDKQNGRPYFREVRKKGLSLSAPQDFVFDLIVPVCHGTNGEDGTLQGLFEIGQIPYAFSGPLASTMAMSKIISKKLWRAANLPILPEVVIKRPDHSLHIPLEDLRGMIGDISFPCIAKPVNLGSSIGVYKVDRLEELAANLPKIFALDHEAMIEPFVENLVEYNVAVTRAFGKLRCSAIERPLRGEAVLDFKDKYLAGGPIDNKLMQGTASEGMASASRVLNPPELTKDQETRIQDWAMKAFDIIGLAGTPRFDFMCNSETGEIWLNEVNPIPGSLAYFLWEAGEPKVTFIQLMNALIEEGLRHYKESNRNYDPAISGGVIFPNRG